MNEYIKELQTMISKNQFPDMGGKNNIDHNRALKLLRLMHNEYEKITSDNSESDEIYNMLSQALKHCKNYNRESAIEILEKLKENK